MTLPTPTILKDCPFCGDNTLRIVTEINTMITPNEMFALWDSNDSKCYKGGLIDWGAYQANPDDIGCMSAQGQVLTLIGEWPPKRLYEARNDQYLINRAVAEVLNISLAHSILLRNINNTIKGAPSIVLTDPSQLLGDQWSKLLDFWWAFDEFEVDDWQRVDAAWKAARDNWQRADAAWNVAKDDWQRVGAAWDAAKDAARDAAWGVVWDSTGHVPWSVAGAAAGAAVGEIQGYEVLASGERDVFFLPMFGWASPADIPARPANYGHII